MSALRVLLASDAFPPMGGGSGWSTYELARQLRRRGHDVHVVQPKPGSPAGRRAREYDGFRVDEIGSSAPSLPFLRNYVKNERLYPRLGRVLADDARRIGADVIHAQHVLTIPSAVLAGASAGVPVVATVRDYWPVCYWGDLIVDRDDPQLCPACTVAGMSRCVRPRAGAPWPLALPLIPYMRGNLARKRRLLARVDTLIAVSSVIAQDLRDRAPELEHTRMTVIPNPVASCMTMSRVPPVSIAAAGTPSAPDSSSTRLNDSGPSEGNTTNAARAIIASVSSRDRQPASRTSRPACAASATRRSRIEPSPTMSTGIDRRARWSAGTRNAMPLLCSSLPA